MPKFDDLKGQYGMQACRKRGRATTGGTCTATANRTLIFLSHAANRCHSAVVRPPAYPGIGTLAYASPAPEPACAPEFARAHDEVRQTQHWLVVVLVHVVALPPSLQTPVMRDNLQAAC